MIRLENLGVRFGSSWALRGLSFDLKPGEVLGLVGPSGSGKSTLLRALAALLPLDEGKALIGGHDVTANPGRARRHVGYMPDQVGYYEALKVEEYLNFYADCHRLPGGIRRHRRIGNLLELIDLEAARHAYVETLSRSMKQRLGLARCLIHDPDVLLLDDPAAVLDPEGRLELYHLLIELKAMRKTILIATHLLADLNGLCTHLAVLRDGRCARFGPAPEGGDAA